MFGDFAENYQFPFQEKNQSCHWSKEYFLFHPVLDYCKDDTDSLQHISICFISDGNSHDTYFVYEVQKTMISYLHELLTQVKKFFYFSDGCGGQYKNYKSLKNLCLYKQDFGLDAEWIFSATSHGKSPCDGIGGSVKYHAAKRSFPRPMNNQILDYRIRLCLMYARKKWAKLNSLGSAKKQWMKCVNHLRNGFQGETLFQIHESATTSYHYHPKLHTI